ncbi:ribonuclease HI [Prochlorococcus sp. MIT 1307]|uniref:ribonuclease HI n=1 Tax=Prochlorococcus sp. MIT 1307 TaxID=3096219 RepID=UPI002A76492E|nr:ribonuclease HI [Prochlorococcus sp. MIT 1307]
MNDDRSRVISAASDGACSGNPGPGGWGALIRFEDGTVKEFGGHEAQTTNNRMELQAVLEILNCLKNLPLHPNLTIRTDSKYLINGMNNWMQGWKRNGWRTSSGKPVLNQDLWQLLDRARLSNVALEFVKGHSGDPDNERVDQIAVSYSKGTYSELNSEQKLSPNKTIAGKRNLSATIASNKPGPETLQKLLTRLDMASHIAKNGYGLDLEELAELIETPISELKKQKKSWEWRDWLVEPIGNSRWRLKFLQQKTSHSEEVQNGRSI